MGDSEKGGEPRVLQRLAPDDSGVVTINIRSSRIQTFWSTCDLCVPIEAGWFFHAASVAGRVSPAKEERRLETAFDPAGSDVRWQHAKIGHIGKADLFLDPGRRYLFYVTPKEAGRDELVRKKRPWPFVFRAARSSQETTLIWFRASAFERDCHRPGEASAARNSEQAGSSLAGFGPMEHDSTASALTKDNKAVQFMVDGWALNGLIQGGAMIRASGRVEDWSILFPVDQSSGDDPSIQPTKPYGASSTGYVNSLSGKPEMGSWHYVIPATDEDYNRNPIPWTETSLKKAISEGRAAALTIGHIIMLGGDLFDDPDDMEKPFDRWSAPQGSMKIYWEARKWLESKKDYDAWQGYQQRYGAIYLIFDLLTKNPKSFGMSTVDEMESAGSFSPTGNVKEEDLAREEREMKGKYVWERLKDRARRVDAVVDFLREASGKTRFSEIHFLTQALGNADGTTFSGIESTSPFLRPNARSELIEKGHRKEDVEDIIRDDVRSTLRAVGYSSTEVSYLERFGPNDDWLQIVVTNGRYDVLALHNETHFSDGGLNSQTFAKFHSDALRRVQQQGIDRNATHPIPAKALFHTGFACHFLTDGFSASHMRVPRRQLGPFTAKVMHDMDGKVGLWVYQRPGGDESKRITWRAFGDGYLRGDDLDKDQKSLLDKGYYYSGGLGEVDTSSDANFQYAAAAVGCAFKQLHYQAHSSTPLKGLLRDILDFNGPDAPDSSELKGDYGGPGRAGPHELWSKNRDMTIAERVSFAQSLMPTPYRDFESGAAAIFANIPPLFTKDNNLNSDSTYWIEKSPKSIGQGRTHYAGFAMRIHWGIFGPSHPFGRDFSTYLYLAEFFVDVQGLDGYIDKRLLVMYDLLPKE
jgi:hypothetical protein